MNTIRKDRQELHRQDYILTVFLVAVFCMVLGYLAYAAYKLYDEHEHVLYDLDRASIGTSVTQHN